jgi:F-type H+-transporting ATPase subunit epsilon
LKTFTLNLLDTTQSASIADVASFVGEDITGNFGIQAGHARFMTVLVTGLAKFRVNAANWQYLALPGGVLYFCNNVLTISSRRYLLDDDYEHIREAMQQQLLIEENRLRSIKESLHKMENELLRQLWELGRRHVT